ncbi:ribose-5-phosphate isomerase [Naumannella halotolerans]|uniref:ribose-5-phosphate isomerase n=1 Tax=Naumannella halotolerans TaxID=993414 RepID=UPI00370D52B1
MRVHLAADHAGFELKAELLKALVDDGYDVTDHGAFAYDPEDDYPGFCIECAEAVREETDALGIVIGGSGNGEQIAANKVEGIRAALVHSEETALAAREHNDAQVAGIGARMHTTEEAIALAKLFLSTPFSQAPRHQRRIDQLTAYEESKR